jgi:outer membrane protein assembly factor BamB
VVYVGSWDGKLYALSASTGAKLWSATIGGKVDSSPIVANGAVYIGTHVNKVWAVSAFGLK